MAIVKRLKRFVQRVANRADLNEGETDLVQGVVRGISEKGSTRLSDIARVIDKGKKVPLIRTEQRLSKGLKAEHSGLDGVQGAYLREVAPVARTLPYVIIDGSQNTHPHGKAFEHIGIVQDRSLPKKPLVPGYWTVNIEVSDAQRRHLPLYHDVYSCEDPAYKELGDVAWQTQFWRGIETVKPYLARDVIGLLDRGFDDIKELDYLHTQLPRHVVRMCSTRNVEVGDPYDPQVWNIRKLSDSLETKYPVDVEYVDKCSHKLKTMRLSFNWVPVRIPGLPWQYYLLVVRGTSEEDWMLLCSFRPHNVAEAQRIVQTFVRRWGVEESIRVYKQCTGAEKVMVRSLVAIRRLLLLAMMAVGLQAVWLFRNQRFARRLIESVKAFIKDVPFKHYRLWDGVKEELVRSG